MEKELVGIFYLLYVLPIWATLAILILIVQLVILVGRHAFEKIPYQVAYSAIVGEGLCFPAMILIIAGILKRGGAYIPLWLNIPQWLEGSTIGHGWLVVTCLIFGVVICWFTLDLRWGHVMDIYHDIVVLPLVLYSAVTLLPVVFYSGTMVEWRAVLGLILLWVASFAFDVKYDRINQRRLLIKNIEAIEQMKEDLRQ